MHIDARRAKWVKNRHRSTFREGAGILFFFLSLASFLPTVLAKTEHFLPDFLVNVAVIRQTTVSYPELYLVANNPKFCANYVYVLSDCLIVFCRVAEFRGVCWVCSVNRGKWEGIFKVFSSSISKGRNVSHESILILFAESEVCKRICRISFEDMKLTFDLHFINFVVNWK